MSVEVATTAQAIPVVNPARALFADKLRRVQSKLTPVKQRGQVESKGRTLFTYGLDIDELEPIRGLLAEEKLAITSDTDPDRTHWFEQSEQKSYNGEPYTVTSFRVHVVERTTITDCETGFEKDYFHPGASIDGDPTNAVKQAQTSARRSMFKALFNLVTDDGDKAKRNPQSGSGSTGSGETPRGAGRPSRNPSTEDQERKIRDLAKMRELTIDGDRFAALLREASNGYATEPSGDRGLSYKDAEKLIAALGKIPLAGAQPIPEGAKAKTADPAPATSDRPEVDGWPPNVSPQQQAKLEDLLSSSVVDDSDIDALVVEISEHRTGDLGELIGGDIDTLIAKLRQLVAKRRANVA